ncbi:membrane hypothetical protein [Alphaproteobacteria bacterium]
MFNSMRLIFRLKNVLLFLILISHLPIINFNTAVTINIVTTSTIFLCMQSNIHTLSLRTLILLSLLQDHLEGTFVGISFLQYTLMLFITRQCNRFLPNKKVGSTLLILVLVTIIMDILKIFVAYCYDWEMNLKNLVSESILLVIGYPILYFIHIKYVKIAYSPTQKINA